MNTLRCIVSSRAERDLEEQAEFLAATSLDVALRFYAAAESCFRYVTLHPDCGSVVASTLPMLTGLRVCRIPEFPRHLVFFRRQTDAITIVRVLHGAADWNGFFEASDPV